LPSASFSHALTDAALRFSYGCSHQLRCHLFMSLVQAHAGHTSPAFQRRDQGQREPTPEGTTERAVTHQCSAVPSGLMVLLTVPGVEYLDSLPERDAPNVGEIYSLAWWT
jgi:hypothetical protein